MASNHILNEIGLGLSVFLVIIEIVRLISGCGQLAGLHIRVVPPNVCVRPRPNCGIYYRHARGCVPVAAVDKTGGGLSLVVIYQVGLLGDRFNARKVFCVSFPIAIPERHNYGIGQ